jgi:hypothetical protein
MADEHDSWFKPFGFDPAKFVSEKWEAGKAQVTAFSQEVKEKGVVGAVTGEAKAAVQKVQAAVSGGSKPAAPAPAPAPKPAAPSGGSPSPGGGSVLSLTGSVGAGGKNNPDDVKAVQRALKISDDGKCGGGTIQAIKDFQKSIGQKNPDGRIDVGGATSKALAGRAPAPAPAPVATPDAPPAPAPDAPPTPPKEEGFLDGLKKKLGAVTDLPGKVIKGAADLGGGKPTDSGGSDGGGGILGGVKKLLGGVADSGGGGAGGGGSARSSLLGIFVGKEYDLDKNLPMPKKKWPAWNGKFEIEIELLVRVRAKVSLDDKDTTRFDNSEIGLKVCNWWVAGKAEPELQKSNGLWTNFKPLTTEGAALVATTSAQTGIGKIEIQVTWIGIEKKLGTDGLKIEPKALEFEGKLEQVELNLGNQEIEGLKLKGLKVSVGGKVTAGPNVKKIIADMLKDQLKQTFEKWAERAALHIGVDALITTGFIAIGVATVVAAAYQVGYGFKLKELGQNFNSHVAQMEAGFKAGMSGGSNPGGHFGNKGFELGQTSLQKIVDKTKQENPAATDEQIKAAVAPRADEAAKAAINSGEVQFQVRKGMWAAFLDEGKWLLTGQDAGLAYAMCFNSSHPKNDAKAAASPEWQEYLRRYPTQSKL